MYKIYKISINMHEYGGRVRRHDSFYVSKLNCQQHCIGWKNF